MLLCVVLTATNTRLLIPVSLLTLEYFLWSLKDFTLDVRTRIQEYTISNNMVVIDENCICVLDNKYNDDNGDDIVDIVAESRITTMILGGFDNNHGKDNNNNSKLTTITK